MAENENKKDGKKKGKGGEAGNYDAGSIRVLEGLATSASA